MICSNIPGNPTDIPTIGLYPVEDVEVLSAMIAERLAFSAEKKLNNKQQQHDYVFEHYNVENWAEEVIKIY